VPGGSGFECDLQGMIQIGDTFYICGIDSHLRSIISNPNSEGDVLVCNITDQKYDPECSFVLMPSDHPQITKPSIIEIRKLTALPESRFDGAALRRSIVFRERCSVLLIEKIIAYIQGSPSVSPKWKRFLSQY
jgi:hypothetical protein